MLQIINIYIIGSEFYGHFMDGISEIFPKSDTSSGFRNSAKLTSEAPKSL